MHAIRQNSLKPNVKKIFGKQSPPLFYQQLQERQNRNLLLQQALQQAPRVGKRVLTRGELFDTAQELFSNMQLKAIEVCKGADRYRPPCEGINRDNASHRFSMGIHRNQVGTFYDDVWENWTTLPHKEILRKGPPSRLLATMFGYPKSQLPVTSREESMTQKVHEHQAPERSEEPPSKRYCPSPQTQSSVVAPMPAVDANPPKDLPDKHHGPKFLKLDAQQRQTACTHASEPWTP